MANRISLRELIDMEELYVKEEPMSFMGSKAVARKAEHAPEGVYFLLDDSCFILLRGKVYRPQ